MRTLSRLIPFLYVVSLSAKQMAEAPSEGLMPILLDPFETRRSFDGSRTLPKPLEDQWLSSFKDRLSLQSLVKNLPPHPEAQNRLKQVQKESLLMDDQETLQAIGSLDQILAKSAPFVGLDELYQERIALEIAASLVSRDDSPTLESSARIPETSVGACSIAGFATKLPTKFVSIFQKFCNEHPPLSLQDPLFSRSLINGRSPLARSGALEIRSGRYLRHRFVGNFVVTESCLVSTVKQIECRESFRRDLFSLLPASILRKELTASKPTSIMMDGLFIALMQQENPIVIIPSSRRIMATKTEPQSQSASIWKSPWLWTGVVVLMGLAGYGIYEGTRDREVLTP